MKNLIILPLILSTSLAFAKAPQTIPDVVQLQGPYVATLEQVQSSVVNMYVQDGGVAVLTISGTDRFLSFQYNTNQIKPHIKSAGKTIAISSDVDKGLTKTIEISTLCGKSITVNIIGLSGSAKLEAIKPKLAITSSTCN